MKTPKDKTFSAMSVAILLLMMLAEWLGGTL